MFFLTNREYRSSDQYRIDGHRRHRTIVSARRGPSLHMDTRYSTASGGTRNTFRCRSICRVLVCTTIRRYRRELPVSMCARVWVECYMCVCYMFLWLSSFYLSPPERPRDHPRMVSASQEYHQTSQVHDARSEHSRRREMTKIYAN